MARVLAVLGAAPWGISDAPPKVNKALTVGFPGLVVAVPAVGDPHPPSLVTQSFLIVFLL